MHSLYAQKHKLSFLLPSKQINLNALLLRVIMFTVKVNRHKMRVFEIYTYKTYLTPKLKTKCIKCSERLRTP